MSIDQFYFVGYLLRKTYMYALCREQVNVTEVDYNKVAQLSESLLSKWIHLMSDFFKKEVQPRRQLKKDDQTIIVEISPILESQFRSFVKEVDDNIRGRKLSVPEKRALMAVLLGMDDPILVNDIFNDDPLIINDLEREAVNLFINSNNALLGREEIKDAAYLSIFLNPTEPDSEVYSPLDLIKKNRLNIKRCAATIRELQKNEEKLKELISDQSEAEKCLISNGVITYKGKSFKLLPKVDDPPLQEQYVAHSVNSHSVDLRNYFTPIRNQESLGSCLSHALVSIYEYFLRCNGLPSPDLSELFLYYNARALSGSSAEDSGSNIQYSMKSLADYGICCEESWPYDEEKFAIKPSDAAYQDAATRKVKISQNVALTKETIRSAIEDGFPVAVSVNLYQSFTTGAGGFVPIPTDDELQSENHGCHAMVICGYSDDEQVFIVRNSWGLDFGDNGYCYMPYSYITNPELTNWAAIIKEIVTAEEVTLNQEVTVPEKVFSVKSEKRDHVNFDHTDASIMMMATQASIAEQRDLLNHLLADDKRHQTYYTRLKQQIADKNLQGRLKEATISRLNLEIKDLQKEKAEKEDSKNTSLISFDLVTTHKLFISAATFLIILVAGLFLNNRLSKSWRSGYENITSVWYQQEKPQVLKYTLILDGVTLLGCGIMYFIRRRRRKELEEEFNEEIERMGVKIQRIDDEKSIAKIQFYISGYILSRLFDLNDTLSGRYNVMKSFQNNLITWYQALKEYDPDKDRGYHPTSVTLLDPNVLDSFFESNKESIIGGLMLSDFVEGYDLSEDGILKFKVQLEKAVIDKISGVLDNFSIYRYFSKEQEYPYLPTVTSDRLINAKLEELDRKAMLFQQFRTTMGASNPQSSIFIHLEDSEMNRWSSIYPCSFSIRPNTCIIESKAKIAVTYFAQMNLADILSYTGK